MPAHAIETEKFLVVGVDFGTTYTGVAHTFSDDPDPFRISTITQWPGAGVDTRPKVPSELTYESGEPKQWGYLFRAGRPRYGGFKLKLDPEAGRKAYNDPHLSLSIDPGNPLAVSYLAPGKEAIEMCVDYLTLIYNQTLYELGKRFPATLSTLKIKFVITTPAMWGLSAQHNTLIAAKQAGFGSRAQDLIEIVSEPEAAAAYTLKCLHREQRQLTGDNDPTWFEAGKQLVICDAGGGTVDLVAYAIDKIDPFLSISQTVEPRGGLCGATALDLGFLNFFKARLGDHAASLTGQFTGRGSTLMRSFDNAKRNFGSTDSHDDDYLAHGIPGLSRSVHESLDELDFVITYEEMKSIFDTVVSKILKLISDVVFEAKSKKPSKEVAAIILVGGFGESNYLYQRISSWGNTQSPPILVCQPKDSWAAIAKGAVSYGLEGIVHRRVLPCHYGVEICHKYDSSIHDSKYNWTSNWDGAVWNNDTISWFAKMGEVSDRENRIKVPFDYETDDRSAVVTLALRTCRWGDPPPSRRDARALNAPPLTISLGKVAGSCFQTKEVGGFLGIGARTIYHVNFTLEMVLGSASIKFEIRQRDVLISTIDVDPNFVGT